MNGHNFIADTNICLHLLAGNKVIEEIVQGSNLYISFITQLELLGYKELSTRDHHRIKLFIDDCIIVDINPSIKAHTIAIRQKHKIKLPDAIIAATSMFLEIPLLTADKGFSKISKLTLALYQE